MSAEEIYGWWYLWLGVAAVVVVAAAALLLAIIGLARSIAALATDALAIVEQIERNTKPIWQLNATNHVAQELLAGAQAIEANAGEIVQALSAADRRRAA